MAVTRTQVSTLASVASATTAVTDFATNPTVGNKVVVGIFAQSATTPPTSVADDGGNAYASALAFRPTTDGIWIYYADNVALPGAGTLSVTVTWPGNRACSIQAISYDGVAAGAPTATNTNQLLVNGTSLSSNAAGSATSALHFAVFGLSTGSNPANVATSAPFTQEGAEQNGATFFVGAVSDQLNALASQDCTWTWTTNTNPRTAGIAAWDAAAVQAADSIPQQHWPAQIFGGPWPLIQQQILPDVPADDGLDLPLLGQGDSSVYWQLFNSASNARSRAYQEVSQRRRDNSPDLLGQPLLENELLGGATTAQRANLPATHVDRREVPQQRQLESVPGLLDTAELENELLGGAETALRTVWRRDPIPPQQRQLESPTGLLDTAELENELLGGQEDLQRHRTWYVDRREVPQYTLRKSASDLLDTAQLEVLPPLPWWYDEAAYLRTPWLRIAQAQADQSSAAVVNFDPTQAGYSLRHVWRRDVYLPTQRPGIQNADDLEIVGTGATGAWWGADDSAHHFAQWLPGPSDPNLLVVAGADTDPTQAGYGPRWMWYRLPTIPQQRQLESVYGLLDQALLEVVPPLGVSPTATHQRLPWLRIRQQQYDQSAAAIITDLDPTQSGGCGPEWRWWYRAPAIPQQRQLESPYGLLDTALLENELLGGVDDLARHRAWSARPWFGLQRAAVIDQSAVSTIFDPTQAGYGPRWMWYRAPVAPVQRERESDPGLLNTALLEDPLQVGYGPRWMWYRPPVAPVQRERRSDPRLLLTALLEDALLGGWDDILRHRTWHVDRREVPQQRSYPDALTPLADPLLTSGAEWRYRLIPVTHRARWVLRQWWQQKKFQGADPLLFEGTIVGGIRSGSGATGGVYGGAGVVVGQAGNIRSGQMYGDGGYGEGLYPGDWVADFTGGTR